MAHTEPMQNVLNFGGLMTNITPDKLPDRNATEVTNIDFSLGGMIQTSRGYSLYGNKVTEPGNCVDAFLYKKNYGTLENIKLRTRDNGTKIVLEWLNPDNKSETSDGYWELLYDNLTTGTKMGFANVNGDGAKKVNKLIMGNAVDEMLVWNGATTSLVSYDINSITCQDELMPEGFDIEGEIILNGVTYSYTDINDKTFLGVTPSPNGVEVGMGIAQMVNDELLEEHFYQATTISFNDGIPSTISDSAAGFLDAGFKVGQKISVGGSPDNSGTWTIESINASTITLGSGEVLVSELAGRRITIASGVPKGNVLLTSQRKLFLAGDKNNPTKVYYSESGNTTCFGITSGLGSGGTFDLIEGGGPITLMEAKGRNTIIVHKKDTIIAYTRDNDGLNTIESFDTLADGFDNGATNFKARAALNKTSYFMTGIEGAKLLEQAIEHDILNMSSITDMIFPTIKDWDHSDAVCAFFPPKRVLLIATNDDKGNRKQIAIYVKGDGDNKMYDVSIDDIPVADYLVENDKLYFVSSLDQNTYTLFDRNSANGGMLEHRYVTKEYIFDSPAMQKEFDTLYVEGLINENGKIRITVEYGIFGEQGSKSFNLYWDNQDVVSTKKISALGTSILGTTSLGANSEEVLDSYIFSCPIHFDVNLSTRYRIKVETIFDKDTDIDHETYWGIFNISADTRLMNLSRLKMQNSNEPSGRGVGSDLVGYPIS